MRVAPVLLILLAAGCHEAPARPASSPAPPITPALPASPLDVASLVARVRPAVVDVTVVRAIESPRRRPPQSPPGSREPPEGVPGLAQQGLGAGFIIDAAGHVITNAHVVDGATAVRVRLADDREVEAGVVGLDPWLDIALLAMRGAKDLPSVPLGGSSALRVGEPVVAIGNPYGLNSTVTMGIVSAKGRAIGVGPYDDFIQTDASINPGNSGGPLFDLHGRVVGVNTAIHPHGKGLGFSIPIEDVEEVLPQLLSKGHVDRGMLGVMVEAVDRTTAKVEERRGARLSAVERGSPAERSGLREGDIIVSVDGEPLTRERGLARAVASRAPGSRVAIGILRGGAPRTIAVTLGAFSDESRAPPPPVEETESSVLGAPVCYRRPSFYR
jgi:serine protease Do